MPLIADPYTDNVLRSIPAEVRDSFSAAQLTALQAALGQVHDRSRHLLDWRFSVNLYWVRYYGVFLFGRDLRAQVQEVLLNRRRRDGRAAQIGFIALFSWLLIAGLVVTALLALYLIKSALGIDIFPDKHLSDFLGL